MALQQHPFITQHANLPNQLVSKKEKQSKDWQKSCMDGLEAIGMAQIIQNERFEENYKLVDGRFIHNHYLDKDEDVYDPLHAMIQKLELPNYIRHYDMISQPINALVGEFTSLPDVSIAKAEGDEVLNQREREKSKLIGDLVMQLFEREALTEAIQSGEMDQQFGSEEEKQQALQQLFAERQNLIPSELKNFDGTWSHISEKWANIMLKNNRQKYNQREKRRIEFRDALITARCFRHFYVTPAGRNEETWNPRNTFYQKGYDIKNPEDGLFVGRSRPMNAEDIINEYGHLLTTSEIKELSTFSNATAPVYKDALGNKVGYTNFDGKPYGVDLPYLGRELDFEPQFNHNPLNSLTDLYYTESDFSYLAGKQYWVTEAYWFAQAKIGKYQYLDEDGELIKQFVDEDFILPPDVKEINAAFSDEEYRKTPNIVIWTYDNELWKGKKITGNFGQAPIYFDVRRSEFQCKGDGTMWEKKLPVVGLIYNNRNVSGQSLVDLMKPYQIYFNVIMNYCYRTFEKQFVPFVAMDTNLIPNQGDWGNKNAVGWLEAAQAVGIAPIDTSYANTAQAQIQGGQYPRIVDVDIMPRVIQQLELAQTIKALGLEQIGFNAQRLGDVKASETATGVQQALAKSYTQTSNYFSEFQDYNRRCLQMGLNFDQYVQSQNPDLRVSALNSDLSQMFLKMNGTDLLMADLNVYVGDAQEEFEKLRLMKQFVLENNTILTKVSTRINILNADSVSVITHAIKVAEEEEAQERQRLEQMQQQQMEQQQAQFEEGMKWEKTKFFADLENKLQQKYIQVFGGKNNAIGQDTNGDGMQDVFEYERIQNEAERSRGELDLKRRELEQRNTADERATRANLAKEQMELNKIKASTFAEAEKTKREEMRDKRKARAQNAKTSKK